MKVMMILCGLALWLVAGYHAVDWLVVMTSGSELTAIHQIYAANQLGTAGVTFGLGALCWGLSTLQKEVVR